MGEGYDPDRFIDRVLHGFKCCICQCVLNEPRLCEAEEHKFCLNCISQHLPNSQTCPECRQHLTLETLRAPGKHFKNILSELRIKCEYINRGCPEHVELGNLQNHVNNCEYRPVTCEECHLEVNAKDEDNHKKSFCPMTSQNLDVQLINAKDKDKQLKCLTCEDPENVMVMNRGYNPNRFVFQVKRSLLCCICHFVLREPRLCEAGEHYFCMNCILQRLEKQSQTCPECQKPLTRETLKHSQSFLTKVLSEQIIKCDYINRGCPEHVELGNLQNHVNNCECRPVTCEVCHLEVNAKDEDNHKKSFCQKRVKHDESRKELGANLEEIANNQDLQSKILNEVVSRSDDISDLMHSFQHETGNEMKEIKRKHDHFRRKVKKMKKSFQNMEETQGEVEVIKRQFERFESLLGHLIQENVVNRNSAQAMEDPTIPDESQDVIILGGWFCNEVPLNTVEKYNIVEEKPTMLPRLNYPRARPASCVYNNDVLVVGGCNDEYVSDKIEVLKMNQHPLRWTMFDGELPVKLSCHDVIVYQEKLYVIGGCEGHETETSNAIYEIALTPPYTPRLLTRMTEPRHRHRAELVNGKLFILGGSTTSFSEDATDSVVVYDFVKNEFELCRSLLQPVLGMSTVTWGTKIIVLGGAGKNNQAINDVIMYDTETGRSEPLPSMIYKRGGCSAVIMNDVITVFGGCNNDQGCLNSVETFTIGGEAWKELPGMIEKRWCATAVVKPHILKVPSI